MEKEWLEIYKQRSEHTSERIRLLLKRQEWLKDSIEQRGNEQDELLERGEDEAARELELGTYTLVLALVYFEKELESELNNLDKILEDIFNWCRR